MELALDQLKKVGCKINAEFVDNSSFNTVGKGSVRW